MTLCVHMYVPFCLYLCVRVRVYASVCARVCMRLCVHMCMHVCMHTRVRVCSFCALMYMCNVVLFVGTNPGYTLILDPQTRLPVMVPVSSWADMYVHALCVLHI